MSHPNGQAIQRSGIQFSWDTHAGSLPSVRSQNVFFSLHHYVVLLIYALWSCPCRLSPPECNAFYCQMHMYRNPAWALDETRIFLLYSDNIQWLHFQFLTLNSLPLPFIARHELGRFKWQRKQRCRLGKLKGRCQNDWNSQTLNAFVED